MLKTRHFRVSDTQGVVSPRGGATLQTVIDDEGMVIKYRLILCHTEDNFSRKEGRQLVAMQEWQHMVYSPPTKYSDLTKRIQQELQKHHERVTNRAIDSILKTQARLQRELDLLKRFYGIS